MTIKQQFDEFVVGYLDNALRLAEIYTKNQEDAKDVVSDSIEKALRNLHTLKDPDLVKGWFNQIIINTSINHLKKNSRNSLSSSIFNRDNIVYHFDDFSHLYIEGLLEALPESERQIVLLRFIDNYEMKEIARILDVNENTVKTRFYRSLRKLKLEIIDEGNSIKVKKERNIAKRVTVSVIVLLLSAMLVFNLSPSLAAAIYEVPILGDIIKVITFNRFEYKQGGYEAEILVPEIKGLLDKELQDKLNTEFREYADELILSFEAAIPEIEELGVDELNGEPAHMSIKADYEVKTNNERVLSIDTYLFSDVVNYVIHKFYTIDKQAGTLIALVDLFKPNADYVTPLSEYILTEMKRLNEEEGGQFDIGDNGFARFNAIRPDHGFYITDDGELVICFDKYEVAPGFVGSPEFVIPSDVIADITISNLVR